MNTRYFILYFLWTTTSSIFCMDTAIITNLVISRDGVVGPRTLSLDPVTINDDYQFLLKRENMILEAQFNKRGTKITNIQIPNKFLQVIIDDINSQDSANSYMIQTSSKGFSLWTRICFVNNENNNESLDKNQLLEKLNAKFTSNQSKETEEITSGNSSFNLKDIFVNKFTALSICLILIACYGYKKWY